MNFSSSSLADRLFFLPLHFFWRHLFFEPRPIIRQDTGLTKQENRSNVQNYLVRIYLGLFLWCIYFKKDSIVTVLQWVTFYPERRIVMALSSNACDLHLISQVDLKPLIFVACFWHPGSSIRPKPGVFRAIDCTFLGGHCHGIVSYLVAQWSPTSSYFRYWKSCVMS